MSYPTADFNDVESGINEVAANIRLAVQQKLDSITVTLKKLREQG